MCASKTKVVSNYNLKKFRQLYVQAKCQCKKLGVMVKYANPKKYPYLASEVWF